MSITSRQARAARAHLALEQKDVHAGTGISTNQISTFERGTAGLSTTNLTKLENFYRSRGVDFLDNEGIRQSPQGSIRQLEGSSGFEAFLDDVYQTAITHGTKQNPCEVFLSNVVHENWIRWMGPEKWLNHTTRMTKDKNVMDVRIIVQEGDLNFPAQAYSKYKWMPKDRFKEKSFYSYHDKLAFLNFTEDNVKITIIRQIDFAEGYRNHFLDTWDYAARTSQGSSQ